MPRNEALRLASEPADATLHSEACLTFFRERLEARRLAPETITQYESDMRIAHAGLGKDLVEVNAGDLVRLVAKWQQEGVASRTLQRRGSVLRQFYSDLFNFGLISSSPVANLRFPRGWSRMARVGPDELERVVESIGRHSPCDLRDRALLLLLRDVGIRAGALAKLLVSDIRWQQRRIVLRDDKFGTDHYVPISHRAAEALREYIDSGLPTFLHGRDLPYLFPYRWSQDTHITRQRTWQIVGHWTRKVLGKPFSPHKWRSTCLTEASANGMDLYDLAALAGHKSIDTTMQYLRHSRAEMKEIFRRSHPRAKRSA